MDAVAVETRKLESANPDDWEQVISMLVDLGRMREYETHPPFHLSADVNRIHTESVVNGLKGVPAQAKNLYIDGLIRELEKEKTSIKGTRLIKVMKKQLKRTARERLHRKFCLLQGRKNRQSKENVSQAGKI